VLTGEQVAYLTDEALLAQLQRVNLFCRVNPQQKLRRCVAKLVEIDVAVISGGVTLSRHAARSMH
jgi:magnesium-transporting ATPase (P-type)